MTGLLLAGWFVLGVASAGIRLLVWWASRGPDLAWRPTGVRPTSGRDYLQAQAIANAMEARKFTARGRRYRRRIELVAVQVEGVGLTRRRPAETVQFLRRPA